MFPRPGVSSTRVHNESAVDHLGQRSPDRVADKNPNFRARLLCRNTAAALRELWGYNWAGVDDDGDDGNGQSLAPAFFCDDDNNDNNDNNNNESEDSWGFAT